MNDEPKATYTSRAPDGADDPLAAAETSAAPYIEAHFYVLEWACEHLRALAREPEAHVLFIVDRRAASFAKVRPSLEAAALRDATIETTLAVAGCPGHDDGFALVMPRRSAWAWAAAAGRPNTHRLLAGARAPANILQVVLIRPGPTPDLGDSSIVMDCVLHDHAPGVACPRCTHGGAA